MLKGICVNCQCLCCYLGCKFWRRGSESNRRIKVLQTSPLPLGYRALSAKLAPSPGIVHPGKRALNIEKALASAGLLNQKSGAGDGGRTRDIDLGKVALYH